jgi:hypothetical protein
MIADDDERAHTPISLAFSGGGKRAALYSLGALLALVRARRNGDIDSVSSVSGGSITNAVIGSRLDLASVEPEQFDVIARDLRRELCEQRHTYRMSTLTIVFVILWAMTVYFPPTRHLTDSILSGVSKDNPWVLTLLSVVTAVGVLVAAASLRTGLQVMAMRRLFRERGVALRLADLNGRRVATSSA